MLQNSNKLLTILLFISIYYTTIVYSAFDTRLQIDADAVVRTDQSIRITNLEISNTVNDAYEEYNSKYGKDTTSMYLILPASSSITYTVEITNKVSDSYLIDSIEEISNTNNNVGVDLSLNINDIVESNSTKIFTITITNDTLSEQHETLVIEYGFKLNRFTVSFDENINLLHGLDDTNGYVAGPWKVGTSSGNRMNYSIDNEIITVTSLQDDGYGFTSVRANLESRKTYIFSCNTDGIWGNANDTVEAIISLDGYYNTYVGITENNYFEFTSWVSGTYWLRLDVNQAGKTYKFWNISVKEKPTQTKLVSYGSSYGTLPTPTRAGYKFLGWNGKNKFNNNSTAYSTENFIRGDNIIEGYQEFNTYLIEIMPLINYKLIHFGAKNRPGYVLYDSNMNYISGENYRNRDIINISSTLNTKYIRISAVAINNDSEGYRYDMDVMQLIRDNEPMEYEPYYITSSTKVVQPNNHTLTAIWEKIQWDYDYTGNVQEFTASKNGTYKLETWGAQGGDASGATGGFGSYSVGTVNLVSGNTIYIATGGAGTTAIDYYNPTMGGYNGGGPAMRCNGKYPCMSSEIAGDVGTGGGATHIAIYDRGELKNYSNNRSELLIVAGGGGGSGSNVTNGGSAGGYLGNRGIGDSSYATGGTQNSGGTDRNNWNGGFGYGSGAQFTLETLPAFTGSGAGGGYYGGGRGFYNGSSSGGGSGYIGSLNLTDKAMYCYGCEESLDNSTDAEKNIFTVSTTGSSSYKDTTNCPDGYSSSPISKCAKAGNGYAKITFISKN